MSTIQVPVFDAPVIRKPSLPIEKDTNLPDENVSHYLKENFFL